MGELITARIRRNATELKLHGIAENPDELIDRAEAAQLGYREFLDLVLENEVGMLDGRRYQARLKMAGLPHHKTLTSSTSPPSPPRSQTPRRAPLAVVHRTQSRLPHFRAARRRHEPHRGRARDGSLGPRLPRALHRPRRSHPRTPPR
jgi:hypothetical protein